MLPVALFLAMKETAYDRSGLPEDCVLTGEETYALQMLSAGRTDGLQAWLHGAEETGERAFYLEEWMDYVLVRALLRRCDGGPGPQPGVARQWRRSGGGGGGAAPRRRRQRRRAERRAAVRVAREHVGYHGCPELRGRE